MAISLRVVKDMYDDGLGRDLGGAWVIVGRLWAIIAALRECCRDGNTRERSQNKTATC
jgi:hypothetical protein